MTTTQAVLAAHKPLPNGGLTRAWCTCGREFTTNSGLGRHVASEARKEAAELAKRSAPGYGHGRPSAPYRPRLWPHPKGLGMTAAGFPDEYDSLALTLLMMSTADCESALRVFSVELEPWQESRLMASINRLKRIGARRLLEAVDDPEPSEAELRGATDPCHLCHELTPWRLDQGPTCDTCAPLVLGAVRQRWETL